MVRCLRSSTQLQKLHVKHIQQVNRKLRVRLNNHTETKIDNFEQTEFLSLFGLHPIHHSDVSKGRTKKDTIYTGRNGSRRRIKSPNDDSNNNELKIQSKLYETLENDMIAEQHIQKELSTKRKSILNNLRDEIADQRKYDTLFEQDKQMNIILNITIKDLLDKIIFICNEKPTYCILQSNAIN